ncbi:MAG: hypothetical protein ABI383_07605 [Acidobacteriaceae bacterium]
MQENQRHHRFRAASILSFTLLAVCVFSAPRGHAQASASQAEAARPVGTVESVDPSGNIIVLKTDAGPVLTVTLQSGGKVFRAPAPGQSGAEKIQLSDVRAGDRLTAHGTPLAEDKFSATAVMVMAKSEVATRLQQEQRAWQRGAGGIVSSVDPATGDIQVKSSPTQTATIHTSPQTGFLRYSPDSVQFKDASKSSFAAIKPGDQLRARGARTPDDAQLNADEVIAGTFRNIAGTVISVDGAQNLLMVQDLTTKKPVAVKITSETQMHQLPPPMAMRIARMVKPSAAMDARSPNADGSAAPHRPGGEPDLQQMLSRTPPVALADLKKGDAVMIVASPAMSNAPGTAVTLISGVEPILTASPNGSGAAELLSNWNMSAPTGAEGPQ